MGKRSGLVRIAVLGLILAPTLAAANVLVPASVQQALSGEPPRLRALMEHALFLGQGTGARREDAQSYLLLCEAASYGSALAHQLAASLVLQYGDAARPYALFHLQAASELGDSLAGARLMEFAQARQADRQTPVGPLSAIAPQCLSGGVDSFIPVDQKPSSLPSENNIVDTQKPGAMVYYASGKSFDLARYLESAPRSKQSVAVIIRRIANEMGLDPKLALAIAAAESNFEPLARSPKNAQGVMQLIPATATRFGVTDAFDVEQNIRGGVLYLKWLFRRFDGRLEHVVAAYNAGEGAVQKHGGIPPFAETQSYVGRVLGMLR